MKKRELPCGWRNRIERVRETQIGKITKVQGGDSCNGWKNQNDREKVLCRQECQGRRERERQRERVRERCQKSQQNKDEQVNQTLKRNDSER